MQEQGRFYLKTSVIPNGLEKYMSFTINNKLCFIDSFQFLNSSLDNLVKNLNKDYFKYLSQEFDNRGLNLVGKERFYPYEHMIDFEKCKGELSSKEKFYSLLSDRKINDKGYEHVINIWGNFEMKTIKDYHNLYVKCDVLLFADVFEKFKNNSLGNYGLCPSHYLSTPVLRWHPMLDLIKDPIIFFEQGTRGRTFYISNRYSKANNKYLKPYDPKQESNHIIYLDSNNLYGYPISKFLPASGFKWIDANVFDFNKSTSNSSKGCVLEDGLGFPKELHELRNDYPLAPDKIEMKKEMLSDYQIN